LYISSNVTNQGINFARSVALDYTGDFLVIGSDLYNNGNGGIMTYLNTTNGWQLQQILTNNATGSQEGLKVAVTSTPEVVIAGSRFYPGPNSNIQGTTFVYLSTTGPQPWSLFQTLTCTGGFDTTASTKLVDQGRSVAISSTGQVIAVGAPNYVNTQSSQGAIFVWYRGSNGYWYTQYLLEGASTMKLGRMVALSADGTILAGGAPGPSSGNNSNGQVWVYNLASSTPTTPTIIIPQTPSNTPYNNGAGVALSADGETLAIGPGLPHTNSNFSVFIYNRNSTVNTWTLSATIPLVENALVQQLGSRVNLSANAGFLVITGADTGGLGGSYGAVYQNVNGNWSFFQALSRPGIYTANANIVENSISGNGQYIAIADPNLAFTNQDLTTDGIATIYDYQYPSVQTNSGTYFQTATPETTGYAFTPKTTLQSQIYTLNVTGLNATNIYYNLGQILPITSNILQVTPLNLIATTTPNLYLTMTNIGYTFDGNNNLIITSQLSPVVGSGIPTSLEGNLSLMVIYL
jgi:hypothetical protein